MTSTKESARESITTISEMVGKGVNISSRTGGNEEDSSGSEGRERNNKI